jgi:hypothetical protein
MAQKQIAPTTTMVKTDIKTRITAAPLLLNAIRDVILTSLSRQPQSICLSFADRVAFCLASFLISSWHQHGGAGGGAYRGGGGHRGGGGFGGAGIVAGAVGLGLGLAAAPYAYGGKSWSGVSWSSIF